MAQILPSTRSVTYHPVNSTGPFPVGSPPFPVFDETGADLLVTLDGEEVGGWTFSGTMESGFYGAPNTWVNGSISFASQISGELIIDGDRMPRRQAQFKEGGGVPARDHNTELNTITAILQEHRRRLDALDRPGGGILSRLLRVRRGKTVSELPDGIANKYLAFDSSENPIGVPAPAVNVSGAVLEFTSRLAVTAVIVPAPLLFLRTAGYYASGDGGGALYKRVVSEPAHAGKVQSADGAWWEISEPSPNPLQFGALADGTLAGAAFMALETFAAGRVIDLCGLTFAVTSEPKGALYINGVFIVSGTPKPMPKSAKSHPFEGALAVIVKDDGNAHFWPGPVAYKASTDTTFISWVDGILHNPGKPSSVRVAMLQNGIDLRNEVDAYSVKTRSVQHVQGGIVNGGRLLLLCSCFDREEAIPENHPKLGFTYSDDDGANWSPAADIAVAEQWSLGYGPMVPGANADTWHFFGYRGSGGVSEIIKVSTTDNGLTWAAVVALSAAGAFVEAWVERLDSLRWFMFLRDDAGGAIRVSKSTDGGVTWSAPVSSGILGGANPLSVLIKGGNLYLYVYARRGAEIYGRSDVQLYWETPVEALWTANGVFPARDRGPRVSFSSKTNSLGYDYFAETPTGLVRCFVSGEDPTGSDNAAASQLIVQVTDTPTISAPAIIKQLRPGKNLLDNGCLTRFSRSGFVSLTGITSARNIFDRWSIDPRSGGNISIAQEPVSDGYGKWFPHSPRNMWTFDSSASPKPFMSLNQKSDDLDLIHRVSSRMLTAQMWGIGSMPGPADFVMTLATGSGGSPASVSTATAVFRSKPMPDGAWHMIAQVSGFDLTGVTIGSNAILTSSFRFEGTDPWAGSIVGMKLELGDPSPLEYGENDTYNGLLRQIQRLIYPTGAVVGIGVGGGTPNVAVPSGLNFFQKRTSAPLIAASSPSALLVDALATSALSVDYVSAQQARLVTTLASGNFPSNQSALIATAAPLTFLIDAELSA